MRRRRQACDGAPVHRGGCLSPSSRRNKCETINFTQLEGAMQRKFNRENEYVQGWAQLFCAKGLGAIP